MYKYNNRGIYQTGQDTAFNNESNLKLIVESHEFSISVGGKVLRNTSFSESVVIVSCDGEHDRWSEKWVCEYEVRLHTATNQAESIYH